MTRVGHEKLLARPGLLRGPERSPRQPPARYAQQHQTDPPERQQAPQQLRKDRVLVPSARPSCSTAGEGSPLLCAVAPAGKRYVRNRTRVSALSLTVRQSRPPCNAAATAPWSGAIGTTGLAVFEITRPLALQRQGEDRR